MMRSFLYLHCSDLNLGRDFYSNVVGLHEIFYSPEDEIVGYRAGELQITLSAHSEAARSSGWARQLGWAGGESASPSWGFECGASEFQRAVAAATVHAVETFYDEPRWVGYWSFPVQDPMRNTVEISTPDRTAWPPPA